MSPEFEKQILVAGVGNAWMLDDGFGSVVAQRLEAREMPSGRPGHGRRLGRARPRLRDHARLPRAGADRRLAPGRGARDAVRDRARPRGDRAVDRGRRRHQPARDGPADGPALRPGRRRLERQGRDRRLRADRRRGPRLGLRPAIVAAVERAIGARRGDGRRAADGRGLQEPDARAVRRERGPRHGPPPRGGPPGARRLAADRAPAPGGPGLARVLLGTSSRATRPPRARGSSWRWCRRGCAAAAARTSGTWRGRRSSAARAARTARWR